MSVIVICGLITVLLFIIYYLSTSKFNYWKKKNVPHLKPTPLLGNYGDYILLKKMYGQVAQKICQAFPKEPYVGAYFGTEPALILQDPEIIKLVTTKDFAYFNSREILKHVHKENFGHTVFMTGGDEWKLVRQNMTPLFTSAKMKGMFHLIEQCAHAMEDMLDREFKMSRVQEVRSLMARYTMDCISACGFGVDSCTMDDNVSENAFNKFGNSLFTISNYRGLLTMSRSVWPAIFYALGFTTIPKSVSAFFHKLITDVLKSRNYTPTSRNDFVDLILDWTKKDYLTGESFKFKDNETKKISLKVNDELLVAQCTIFFGAGFETSAGTMSYTLYELAKNPELQQRAFEDVEAYLKKNNNKLGYDCITEMPFLSACLDEAIRMYPVLNVVTREVVEDYTLPTGLHLDKGVRIHLPVYHLHHNPEFFPEPEEYRPQRFLPEERHKIIPYTYMPFGEGPRVCIGMRFAKMQTLSGLAVFLKKYRVELAPGMPSKIDFEPRAVVTMSKVGINLNLYEREGWQQRVLAN